ncbi:MAG: hypothetical protein OXE57_18835, partial [Alphaproteobacteria bacterium]|nr:hypothetical protein [Alphaproteobacteria bacterium]
PHGIHEVEALVGRQTVSGAMSCSLCGRTCLGEPGWMRVEVHDGRIGFERHYPWKLVAFCPAVDCAEKGSELVALILCRLERWHSAVDPAWYRYAGLPAGKPSHRTARLPFAAGRDDSRSDGPGEPFPLTETGRAA